MASSQELLVAEQIIRAHVLRHYEAQVSVGEEWRDLPEVPNKSEILSMEKDVEKRGFFVEAWDAYQKEPLYDVSLPHNIIKGPWPSKESYIATHYQILREDAIAGLRNAIRSIKREPHKDDDHLTHVYTHVHFKGMVLSHIGPAFRIEFSHDRAGKQIRWQQSNRLQQGTMVALSPMNDSFRSICKIAIVAARPYEGGLDQNPPQIDIFWGEIGDTVFDPIEPYVMVEARSAYFEASRHMLVALQKLRTEKFHLSTHLAGLDQNIGAPEWLEERRFLNLTSLIQQELHPNKPILAEEELALVNADALQEFPKIPFSGMDDSQLQACERMITKRVSIVQGPPGTGKTFTSVSALHVLTENMDNDSPPIVVAAQTNHALDQLMNHIMAFEPNVLRLGGRSEKENVAIKKRTLYILRSTTKDVPNGYKGMKPALTTITNMQQEIQETMSPLLRENILCEETLFRAGIITEAQKNSLDGQSTDDGEVWANADASDHSANRLSALHQWVGGDMVPMPHAPLVNHGLPMEEADLEFEQLQEVEQNNEDFPEEKGLDVLKGITLTFGRTLTSRCPSSVDDRKIKKLLASKKDLHEIPMGVRGQAYRYFEKQLNKVILAKLKEQLRKYKSATDDLRIAKWMSNVRLIKHLGIKVIGCTTTGLSKYRGLLAGLQPRTLLIEEAAETLEGTVMAGMFESLQQLILVGDHKQLQANSNVRALEGAPYHLSTSMFERLVENSIGFTMLNQQRRMIPDVRELLCIEPEPFYKNLLDHPSVLDRNSNRIPVPGMGGKDTYFFHHNWPELKSSGMSQCNPDEADMIVEFFNYLVLNGVPCSKITVLTFYNGQRKTILQALKRHPTLNQYTYFNVFTVDSYQGEENDVILLSLVRSNDTSNIGFLDNKNRLVVALSRARRGLYVFGNAITLTTQETSYGEDVEGFVRDPMWQSIILQMRSKARFDMDGGLPITCSNHGKTVRVYDASGWDELRGGGCNQLCGGALSCGHLCPFPCHPFDHTRVLCAVACTKILNCGHGCSGQCGEECYCDVAECRKALIQDNVDVRTELGGFGVGFAGDSSHGSPSKPGLKIRPLVAQYLPSEAPNTFNDKFDQSPSGSQDDRRNGETEMMAQESPSPATKRNLSVGDDLQKSNATSHLNVSTKLRTSPPKQALVNAWKTWDAKKADKEVNDERLRLAALPPTFDPATLVYNDKYIAVKINEKGLREKIPDASSTTVIQRIDPSLLHPISESSMAASETLYDSASENATNSPSSAIHTSTGVDKSAVTSAMSGTSIDDLLILNIQSDTFGSAEDMDAFERLLSKGS